MHKLDAWWQDVRRGARGLARTPAFTLAAALTLALGIGANAAIFSVVNAVLLKPLPYSHPERRVTIWSRWVSFDKTWLADGEVLDYRRRCRTLASVAAWGTGRANLTGAGAPLRVGFGAVTANTFSTLGAEPLLGRGFTGDEDRPGGEPVVVLGYGLWQQHFGGDPAILGRAIEVNGVSRRVVGVMRRGFRLPTDYGIDRAEPTALWIPLQIDPATASHGNHGLYGAAELAPGATAADATAELKAVTADMTREGLYHAAMRFSAFAVPVEDEVVGSVRPALLLLAGAVGFLLLIACVNVANLLLARAEGRQREMAIRTALGAGRGRLVGQLLAEGLVLAVLGGAAGLGLAWAGVRALAAADPAGIPRVAAVAVDGRVLLFAALVSLATTALFSLVPALRAARVDVNASLKDRGPQGAAGGRRQSLRRLLVVTEMALAVVLLVGAGLMIRSLAALQRIDVGFDPGRVLTLSVSLPRAAYDSPEKMIGFYGRLLARVRALPGVDRAGLVRSLPLSDSIGDWGLDVDGFVETPGHNAKGDWQVVSDGAIETLGERIVRGRTFTAADTPDSQLVAMINETMAARYWGGRDPIGGRIRMGGGGTRPWLTVVGIVKDVRHNGMTARVKEKFYVPYAQFRRASGNSVATMYVVAKTAGDPLAAAAPIEAEVRRLDPNLPVANVRPMAEVVAESISTPRLTGFLLGLFALVALALAAVGIYGVLAYLVSRRTHEIGIRMAVGASAGSVVGLVLRSGLALSLAGIAVGLGAAAGLTRLMGMLLYGVTPLDPATFLAVPVVLGAVALAASGVPAWRAARVDPLRALRAE